MRTTIKSTMRSTIQFLLTSLLVAAPLCAPAQSKLSADVICEIPASSEAVANVTVTALLFEYEPLLADAPAKEIDSISIHGVDLRADRVTLLRFPLRGTRTPDRQYYVTVDVYPDRQSNEQLYLTGPPVDVFRERDSVEAHVMLRPPKR